MLRRLCVFCGSSVGFRPEYAEAARSVGKLLATRGIGLVYGGSNAGLMKQLADSCLAAGGEVIGVIPQSLVDKERAHHGITKLYIVQSMHERKAMMADVADGFLALPGGFGTWEEFCEVLTWSQLGLQNKACAILNVLGYYDALLDLADRAVEEGFLLPVHRRMLLAGDDPERLVDDLESFVAPVVEKWLDSTTR
jgi:uncharacterized protein (TIGR00730 family)